MDPNKNHTVFSHKNPKSVSFIAEIQHNSVQIFHHVKICVILCWKKNPKNKQISFNILAQWLKKWLKKIQIQHTCQTHCSNVIKTFYSQENESRYSNELHSNVFSRVNPICHHEKFCFIIFWLLQEWFIYQWILNCSGENRKNQDTFILCGYFF